MQPIDTSEALHQAIAGHPIVLAYFMGGPCAACHAIQGELERILTDFPLVTAFELQVDEQRALAASFEVFAVPTAILFVQGKEALRFGRHIDLLEFRRKLDRYSHLLAD